MSVREDSELVKIFQKKIDIIAENLGIDLFYYSGYESCGGIIKKFKHYPYINLRKYGVATSENIPQNFSSFRRWIFTFHYFFMWFISSIYLILLVTLMKTHNTQLINIWHILMKLQHESDISPIYCIKIYDRYFCNYRTPLQFKTWK